MNNPNVIYYDGKSSRFKLAYQSAKRELLKTLFNSYYKLGYIWQYNGYWYCDYKFTQAIVTQLGFALNNTTL